MRRPVKLTGTKTEAADHGEHAARMRVERNNRSVHLRHLLKLEKARRVCRCHPHNIADRKHLVDAGNFRPDFAIAIFAVWRSARPRHGIKRQATNINSILKPSRAGHARAQTDGGFLGISRQDHR